MLPSKLTVRQCRMQHNGLSTQDLFSDSMHVCQRWRSFSWCKRVLLRPPSCLASVSGSNRLELSTFSALLILDDLLARTCRNNSRFRFKECAGARVKIMRHIDFGTDDQIRGRISDEPGQKRWRVGQRRRERDYNDMADGFQNVPDFGTAVESIAVSICTSHSIFSASHYILAL